jgi:RNA polymerase sigma-70 factor (ECF subfamily)
MTLTEFNAEFNLLNQPLRAFAYFLTKNTEDAHDLFQETAYRAFANIEKYNDGTNLKAWCVTIMRNIFINDYRKKSKSGITLDASENQYLINNTRSVSNAGESKAIIEEIDKAINKLDIGIKKPFLMHYEGYKYQEIADIMQLPLGTVKSRIFFARKELQQALKGFQ